MLRLRKTIPLFSTQYGLICNSGLGVVRREIGRVNSDTIRLFSTDESGKEFKQKDRKFIRGIGAAFPNASPFEKRKYEPSTVTWRKSLGDLPPTIRQLYGRLDFVGTLSKPSRDMINIGLKQVNITKDAFDNHEHMMKFLIKLERGGFSSFYDDGVRAFINNLLKLMRDTPKLDEEKVFEILRSFSRLNFYLAHLPTVTEQSNLIQFIDRINVATLEKNFELYCEYFYLLAELEIPWQSISREKRKRLFFCLKRFGKIDDSRLLRSVWQLIYGIDELLILRNYPDDVAKDVKDYYENLLLLVLEGKFSKERKGTLQEEPYSPVDTGNYEMPISNAILSQLKTLSELKEVAVSGGGGVVKGSKSSTPKLSIPPQVFSLILNGLEQEWTMKNMDVYKQSTAMLRLGEIGVTYKVFDHKEWDKMMEDTAKKMADGIRPKSLSSILKGWKLLQYHFDDMEENLKEAVTNAVAELCRDEKATRQMANVILYLGEMKTDWVIDLKNKNKEILQGIKAASDKLNNAELSNLLLGLAKMFVTWQELGRDLQDSLLKAIGTNLLGMNIMDLSNNIYSLGTLNLPWNKIPKSLQDKLIGELLRKIPGPDFKIIDVNATISGLNKMDYDWILNERFYALLIKKIDYFYGDWDKISRTAEENIDRLLLNLAEGGFYWREVGNQTQKLKMALLNGAESYCRKEPSQIDVKKVANLLDALSNLGVTLYDLPASTRKALESTFSLASRITAPNFAVTFIYSLGKMQYSWEMLTRGEVQTALIEMIKNNASQFTAEDVSDVGYALAVMSGSPLEVNSSDFLPLHEGLVNRYYDLINNNLDTLSDGKKKQLAAYFEWLEALSPSALSNILQSAKKESLPELKVDITPSAPSDLHLKLTSRLQTKLNEEIERRVRAGSMTEEEKSDLLRLQFVNGFYGLKRQVLPMNLAIIFPTQGESGTGEVLSFIDFDAVFYQRPATTARQETLVLDTIDRFKENLYRQSFKRFPLIRLTADREEDMEREMDEVIQKLLK